MRLFVELCFSSSFVLTAIISLVRLSQDDEQGLTSCFDVDWRLPVDDRAFEDEWLETEGTDWPQLDKPRLVDFLSEAGDHPRWQVEDDDLVHLRVIDVGMLPDFRIDEFFGADAVLTASERSELIVFFFDLDLDGFVVSRWCAGWYLCEGEM